MIAAYSPLLRSAVRALLAQGALHGELVRLDWAEEKQRLLRLLLALLAGTICLFCSLLSLGALVLIVSWNTPYQHAALYALVGFFCTGTLAAGYCLHRLVLQGSEAFADTRAELSADLALIRSKLGEQS